MTCNLYLLLSSPGGNAEGPPKTLFDDREVSLHGEDQDGNRHKSKHHANEDDEVLNWIDVREVKALQNCNARLTKALELGIACALEFRALQDGDSRSRIGVEGRIDVKDPPIVRRHERLGHNEATAETTDGGKHRTETMGLAWHEDCQDDEYREPHLIDEQEGQQNGEVDFGSVCLIDERKHDRGTDREREGAHCTHSDEHL